MHSFETSLTAGWLTQLGTTMGEERVAADTVKPTGYLWNTSFPELNRHTLPAACPDDARGHPDRGWVEYLPMDHAAFGDFPRGPDTPTSGTLVR